MYTENRTHDYLDLNNLTYLYIIPKKKEFNFCERAGGGGGGGECGRCCCCCCGVGGRSARGLPWRGCCGCPSPPRARLPPAAAAAPPSRPRVLLLLPFSDGRGGKKATRTSKVGGMAALFIWAKATWYFPLFIYLVFNF